MGYSECPECEGNGYIGEGWERGSYTITYTCHVCKGTGEIYGEKDEKKDISVDRRESKS